MMSSMGPRSVPDPEISQRGNHTVEKELFSTEWQGNCMSIQTRHSICFTDPSMYISMTCVIHEYRESFPDRRSWKMWAHVHYQNENLDQNLSQMFIFRHACAYIHPTPIMVILSPDQSTVCDQKFQLHYDRHVEWFHRWPWYHSQIQEATMTI